MRLACLRRLTAGAVALALSLGLGACAAPDRAAERDRVVVGLVTEPTSLDLTRTDGAAIAQVLLGNVYEGLVRVDDEGRIVPALASGWTVSPDRRTYTFDLRPGVTFTDGAPMTADDVVFSLRRVRTDWAVAVKKSMDVVQDVRALTPTRVQVTLSRPSASWLYAMTTRVGVIFSRTGVADLATAPVGTGPYRLTRWRRGDAITLTRNEGYHGPRPFFRDVTVRYVKDAAALDNALLSGAIDLIGTVPSPDSVPQLRQAGFQVVEGTTNAEVMLTFNHRTPLLRDRRVRQAIRQAIDHRGLLDTCWGGHGTLLGAMVPPTDPWWEDLTATAPHDRAAATTALREAGAAGRTLRLRLPATPYAAACGQVVRSDLERAGLRVAVDQMDFPTWLTDVFRAGDYDLTIVSHVEPRDLVRMYGDPTFYAHYDNPRVRAELAAADTGTPADQTAHMRAAARLVAEDAAGDVLFLMPHLVVADPSVTGIAADAVGESFDLARLARR